MKTKINDTFESHLLEPKALSNGLVTKENILPKIRWLDGSF